MKLSWLIPSCCICWKSCITFSGCPPFHIFCKLLLPCKKVPGAIAAISGGTHGEFCAYSSQSALPVSSYVWNSSAFHLSTTRNRDQAHQPCTLHIPGINSIIRTEKAATVLLHQQEKCVTAYCTYFQFSSLRLLSYHCKGSEKNFCQSLDHSRMAI